MSRGRRRRVATGVYEDRSGLAAVVKVGRRRREQRFPPGTSLEFIQAWRQRVCEDFLDDQDAGAPTLPGTYADDLEGYLQVIATRVAFRADRSHLRAWLPALGAKLRRQVRPSHVGTVVRQWQTAGKSARTIRHRLRVLRELYRRLDGPHAPTPVTGIALPRIPAPHPVAVPWAMVQRVAKSLERGKVGVKAHGPTKRRSRVHYPDPVKGHARFLVLATTGQRPAQVMRAEPADVDLKRRIWFVRPAKGGTAVALPLDPAMVRAWKAFMAAKAWGPYDSRSFSLLLRRHGWPAGVRPYQLRHTLAIDLILGGADLGDVQAALGHRQIETTRRHYAPIQLARLRRSLKLAKRGGLA